MSQDLNVALTLPGTASYLHCFAPHASDPTFTPRYGVALILPLNYDFAPIQQAIDNAIMTKWPNGKPQSAAALPWKWGKNDVPAEAGRIIISAYSPADKQPEFILDENHQPILNPADIYSGCEVQVGMRFFGYTTGSGGVSAAFNGIMKIADGARLGGGQTKEQMFGPAPTGAPPPTAQPQQPVQQPQQQQQPVQPPQPGMPGNDNGYMPAPAPVQQPTPAPVQQPAPGGQGAGMPSNVTQMPGTQPQGGMPQQ